MTYLTCSFDHWPLLVFIIGYLLDFIFGDPERLPHPVVLFGKMIARGERYLNRGNHRIFKGALLTITLILLVYTSCYLLLYSVSLFFSPDILSIILIFYCLAGTTLIREVRNVFIALERSLDDGRKQVARIVGRDTSQLSEQEVRTAALETLAENLSDGVIAPMFWFILLGVPGMLAYKMVNTLDSMIAYHTERYLYFGRVAAYIDDIANFIPARLTALLMIAAAGKWKLISFVIKYGNKHASPNSGWPEAALAGILDCRFGGPHIYFGKYFPKPYIGNNPRPLVLADMYQAIKVNRRAELIMVFITSLTLIFL